MRRTAKILLWTVGGIVAAVLICNVILYPVNVKTIIQAALDRRRCDRRFAQLRHDLPVGTSREGVISYLHVHTELVTHRHGDGDTLSVDLGRVQSTVWFCGWFEEYADLTFRSNLSHGSEERLLSQITTGAIGECL
jgi:hypothetical protein